MKKLSFKSTDPWGQLDELQKMVDAHYLNMTLICRRADPPVSTASPSRWRKGREERKNPPKTTTLLRLLLALQEVLEEIHQKTGK